MAAVAVPKLAAVAVMLDRALIYPPPITALAVLKFVICDVVAYTLVNDAYPPVMATLPELKFVACSVVNAPTPLKVVADNVPVLGLNVSDELVSAAALPVALS